VFFAGRNPLTNEVLVPSGQQITEVNMKAIDASNRVEVRSPLVCEALKVFVLNVTVET
jgi:DNA-directed RNA polymerase subunit beta'